MKKGLDKYFERCQKKGLQILSSPKDTPNGYRNFTLRDPFGIKLIVAQPREGVSAKPSNDFVGMHVDLSRGSEADIMSDKIGRAHV